MYYNIHFLLPTLFEIQRNAITKGPFKKKPYYIIQVSVLETYPSQPTSSEV